MGLLTRQTLSNPNKRGRMPKKTLLFHAGPKMFAIQKNNIIWLPVDLCENYSADTQILKIPM